MIDYLTFSSARLTTRLLTDEDVPNLFRIYADKVAMKFRGSDPMHHVDDAYKMVAEQNVSENGETKVRCGIVDKTSNGLIGTLLLTFNQARPTEILIGYSFDKKVWNMGFGKETVGMVLERINKIDSLNKVKAWCEKENLASIKILEKMGFTKMNQNLFPESYLYVLSLPN